MATLMSQFGPAGVSGLVYSMSNSLGCMTTLVFCWAVGRFLDQFGESLNCWSGVMYTLGGLNVVYIFVYAIFCHSKPVKLDMSEKKGQKDHS